MQRVLTQFQDPVLGDRRASNFLRADSCRGRDGGGAEKDLTSSPCTVQPSTLIVGHANFRDRKSHILTSSVIFQETCVVRADRLLSLLMTLQVRGQVTAEALAKQLEVSTRTIYRDIDALSHAGVPIVTDRGRGGGVSLIAGYRTELTGLSASESEALPFAGLDAAAAALGLEASAEAARLKVFAALPPAGRTRAHRARECFYLDPADWYRRTVTPPHLRAVAAATWGSHSIELDYES